MRSFLMAIEGCAFHLTANIIGARPLAKITARRSACSFRREHIERPRVCFRLAALGSNNVGPLPCGRFVAVSDDQNQTSLVLIVAAHVAPSAKRMNGRLQPASRLAAVIDRTRQSPRKRDRRSPCLELVS